MKSSAGGSGGQQHFVRNLLLDAIVVLTQNSAFALSSLKHS
jgi:hypothetical protein